MQQLTIAFDYAGLDSETRIVVQQRTTEIKGLMRKAAQDIIDIGQKLIEVKERLSHGQFGPWLEAEFQWSAMTAQRFMHVAVQFKSNNLLDLNIAPSALYLLAAPSTPDEARQDAIARAEAGEAITHAVAKEIIADQRIADLSDDDRRTLIKRLANKRLRYEGSGPDYILVARDIEFKEDAREQHRLETLADAERVLKLPVPPAPPSRWVQPVETPPENSLPEDFHAIQHQYRGVATVAVRSDGGFQVFPLGGQMERCDTWGAVKRRLIALAPIHLPEDFKDAQVCLGDRGMLTMDARTGEFSLHYGQSAEYYRHDRWQAVCDRVQALKMFDWTQRPTPDRAIFAPPPDLADVQERLGDRGSLTMDVATGDFCVIIDLSLTHFRQDDARLRWRLTKEFIAAQTPRESSEPVQSNDDDDEAEQDGPPAQPSALNATEAARWLDARLIGLAPHAIRMLAQALVPASTRPWIDDMPTLRRAIAQRVAEICAADAPAQTAEILGSLVKEKTT